VLKTANDIYNFLKPEIIGIQKEIFFVIYLDNRCKLIEKKIISIGTSTGSLVDIKEIFKYALKNNSYYVIIAHNHPSNSTNPSKNDVELTKKIVESGKIMNVNIIDHIILGNNNYFSFLENNLI
jgi:DNA repair protein RadC